MIHLDCSHMDDLPTFPEFILGVVVFILVFFTVITLVVYACIKVSNFTVDTVNPKDSKDE